MPTVRLTTAQALVRFMINQKTRMDGELVPLFAGVWAIFGHGNVAGLGEALYSVRDVLPTYRGHNEQSMAHAAIAFAKAWRAAQSGTNRGRTAVLEHGMEFQALGMSNEDAQFLETLAANASDIARIFRVPPPAIGILDKATYSNITEQSRSLVMHTLRPWLVRIEQAMTVSLLSQEGRHTHFIEHNAEGLLRGNQKERFEAYRIAREWGWLSVNEIRRKENMGGIGEKGDGFYNKNGN